MGGGGEFLLLFSFGFFGGAVLDRNQEVVFKHVEFEIFF